MKTASTGRSVGRVGSGLVPRRNVCLMLAAFVAPGLLAPVQAQAISDRVIHDVYSGIAIGGYDPVAYFAQHEARKGVRLYELALNNSYWRFANEGNMLAFRDAPNIYAPAYGGYGVLSIASGRLTPGNPEIWAIYKDRLFFFFTTAERRQWLSDPEGYILQADVRWKVLEQTLAAS